jgi:hypothetical protein
MRAGWIVVGVVLLLVGAVLLFVPVIPQTNEVVSSSADIPFYAASVSGYSLTGSVPVAVTWTSSASTTVAAAVCSGSCTNTSQISGVTYQTGTSGSFTLNQPNGGSIVMGEESSGNGTVSVTFKITSALSTVGSLLVVVGIIALLVGIVAGRKPKPAPGMMAQPGASTTGSGNDPPGVPPPDVVVSGPSP